MRESGNGSNIYERSRQRVEHIREDLATGRTYMEGSGNGLNIHGRIWQWVKYMEEDLPTRGYKTEERKQDTKKCVRGRKRKNEG
ncbi:hypothetical protein TNCT_629251 [Trichonephila clavata]|uniref:Uncharacterized protein n=1 Tax=Trichonephila clavata TaxID=2740835 RepID=A0A8X6HBA6_TRICU|nr:hypothetical protein TNCT_629251 [Trichonephila clavata]